MIKDHRDIEKDLTTVASLPKKEKSKKALFRQIDFFKLRYAYQGRWALYKAARFLYGQHPEIKPKGILDTKNIEKIYNRLWGSRSSGVLKMVQMKFPIYDAEYDLDSILAWAEDTKGLMINPDVIVSCEWARGNIIDSPISSACDCSFFQHVASALWMDCKLKHRDTAEYLEKNYAQIAESLGMYIYPKSADTIEEYISRVSNKREGEREREPNLDKICERLLA